MGIISAKRHPSFYHWLNYSKMKIEIKVLIFHPKGSLKIFAAASLKLKTTDSQR
jgi:hypothetical protein